MAQYTCQRCKLPLVIDDSLQGLSNAQKHLLTLSYGQRPNEDHPKDLNEYPILPAERVALFEEASKTSGSKPLVSSKGSEALHIDDGSFVILEDKDQPSMDKVSVSERVASLDNIFNILSSKYEIDYPVCTDCASTLIEELKQQFEQMTKEKDTYVQFLKKLTAQSGPNRKKAQDSLSELALLKEEETKLLEELEKAEREQEELTQQLVEVEQELEDLENQEKEFCLQKNAYDLELIEFVNERERIKASYEYNLNRLDSLRKTNVFNDVFMISHDDQFGTINGLRLGNLDNVKVSWHEINAALGQLALLLATVVRILDFQLDGYRIIPMGSTSRIEKYRKDRNGSISKQTLDLFSSGEFSIGKIFTHNQLDAGMVALVDIVSQIGRKLKQLDESNDLPYKMTEDKVAGYPIKPSARSSNEEWTSACRYLLTNAKWILTYCIART
ncbi:hypothetical protein KL905_000127 [Ogataea polymorpha]|uniref:Uncharacterized protein n=2 Tax=Ogataea TaxID=461281 RepID=A0A1B7SJ47_9ASCO|nr:uncharacterized protein OGAPODRAFT_87135 [Ogataea polymorpha]ABO31290.1 Atg6p [Ogataea angusta]KAG7882378.1 hypothetical protein KL937_000949 [Ogataea polymorpha]KAG7891537.1 hypothetical protein KL936_001480 [Ogataea polymorpha]KAG7894890.1 hypothetical protein KL908_001240 [Ogataea polymorpha]KAG7902627.1 hypothetical protein KL935_001535 [Ogataea polymorpha]